MGTEIEARLAVVGPERSALFEQVKALQLILDVRIGPFALVQLRDEYFDDGANSLLQQGCSLRLREATDEHGTRTLLTFKGPGENNGTHCVQRTELEQPWSTAFAEEVLDILRERGIELAGTLGDGTAKEALAGLGLNSIQVRENRRQYALLGLPSRPIAELTLDLVTYRAGKITVAHREIEIEARGKTSPEELLTLADDFEDRFPGCLMPWPWSKTAVGRGLERLHARDELAQLLPDGAHELDEAGYRRLAVYLKLGDLLGR